MVVKTDEAALRWRRRLGSLWNGPIPLVEAMGIEIRSLDAAALVLVAPLALNSNHMGTAFGGSLQAIATLAGWGITVIAAGDERPSHVVVSNARMQFLEPLSGELVAECFHPEAGALAAFQGTLRRRGRARLTVPVLVPGPGGRPAARFVGEFVALLAS
jgi:thioesterase domain-containing protein